MDIDMHLEELDALEEREQVTICLSINDTVYYIIIPINLAFMF